MEIRIDGDDGVPVYRQIVEAIKHQVAVGALAPGARLPTLRRLAQELGVDRNTVVRAYRVLSREGVISLQQGRGSFVKSHSRHPEVTRHRHERLQLIVGESIARALSLGYSPDEIEHTFANRLAEWKRAQATESRRHQPHSIQARQGLGGR